MSQLQRTLTIAVLLVTMALGLVVTAARMDTRPLPSFDDCLRGRELALHKEFASGHPSVEALFLSSDESNYLRTAGQIARGEVATDYLGDFIVLARDTAPDPELLATSAQYRTARALGRAAQPGQPYFVSYRSVVFPMLGAPILRAMGCNSAGLRVLRYAMLPFRALMIAAAGLLAWLLVPRYRWLALCLASTLVALDAQLNDAGAGFMADLPGSALFMLWLCGLTLVTRRRSLALALGVGLLAGLTATVKADFLYVLPLAGLCALLAVAPAQRRALALRLLLALSAYVLVLGTLAARNHHHTGDWFITSKDTINLYLGNSPDAPLRQFRFGMSPRELAVIESMPAVQAQVLREHSPEVAFREFFRRQFIDEVKSAPGQVLATFFQRAWLFLQSGGVAHFPALNGLGHTFSLALMAGAVLMAAWPLFKGWGTASAAAPLAISFLASLGIVSLVYFEPRYLSHLFPMAIVVFVQFVVGGLPRLAASTDMDEAR